MPWNCSLKKGKVPQSVMWLWSQKAKDVEVPDQKAKKAEKFGDKKKSNVIVGNECPVCKKVFTWNYQLHVHIRKKHMSYHYSCVHCSKTFLTNNGLYKHNLTHKVGKYQCTICNKSFHFPQRLQNHERLHMDTRANLRQHFCGNNGKGIKSLCEKYF